MSFDLTVIIPFLNEEENIPSLINSLNEYFSKQDKKIKTEIIFINDGSSDNSKKLLEEAKHNSYSAKLINFSKNFGSHAALRAGILMAKGKFVTFTFADGQDPLELIEQLHNKAIEGFDTIWAERLEENESRKKTFFSRVYAYLMKKYVHPKFPEGGFDVVMFNENVKNELNSCVQLNTSLFIQILSLGFKQTSIQYKKNARKAGTSKWTISKKIKLVIDSLIGFSFLPIRVITTIGIILILIGFLLKPSVLLIAIGLTNISLGILGEYLHRILDNMRNKAPFIIEGITEL